MADDVFQIIVGQLDTPMFVVTTRSGDETAGCLVGFATQTSLDPPRFLVCISRANRTFRVVERARTVVVHALERDDRPVARLFGEDTGDEVDKFSLCRWRAGPDGVPVLDLAGGWFAGRILDRVDLGDHVGLLLDPYGGDPGAGRGQLGYQAVRDLSPGHPG